MGKIIIDIDNKTIDREGKVLRRHLLRSAVALIDVLYEEAIEDPDVNEEEIEELVIKSVKDVF